MKGEGFILGGLFVIRRGGAVEYESPELTFGDAPPLDEVFAAAATAAAAAAKIEPAPLQLSELGKRASVSWDDGWEMAAAKIEPEPEPEPEPAALELLPVRDLDWLDESTTAWTQDASLSPLVLPASQTPKGIRPNMME